MSYRADKQVLTAHRRTDGRTHRQTDAGNDNTRRPKLASGNIYIYIYTSLYWESLNPQKWFYFENAHWSRGLALSPTSCPARISMKTCDNISCSLKPRPVSLSLAMRSLPSRSVTGLPPAGIIKESKTQIERSYLAVSNTGVPQYRRISRWDFIYRFNTKVSI